MALAVDAAALTAALAAQGLLLSPEGASAVLGLHPLLPPSLGPGAPGSRVGSGTEPAADGSDAHGCDIHGADTGGSDSGSEAGCEAEGGPGEEQGPRRGDTEHS
ncbi:hypothetical protein V8C86DRAFT_2496810 [Haematococcus lacustris]